MSRHTPEMAMVRMQDDHQSSRSNTANVTSIGYFGRVVNGNNVNGLIQVRIEGVDDEVTDENLPWCFSSTPNFLYWKPQINDMVAVIMLNPWNKNYNRLYYGPIHAGLDDTEQNYKNTTKKLNLFTYEK